MDLPCTSHALAMQLVTLFKSYFEGDLCEKSIKDNFVLM